MAPKREKKADKKFPKLLKAQRSITSFFGKLNDAISPSPSAPGPVPPPPLSPPPPPTTPPPIISSKRPASPPSGRFEKTVRMHSPVPSDPGDLDVPRLRVANLRLPSPQVYRQSIHSILSEAMSEGMVSGGKASVDNLSDELHGLQVASGSGLAGSKEDVVGIGEELVEVGEEDVSVDQGGFYERNMGIIISHLKFTVPQFETILAQAIVTNIPHLSMNHVSGWFKAMRDISISEDEWRTDQAGVKKSREDMIKLLAEARLPWDGAALSSGCSRSPYHERQAWPSGMRGKLIEDFMLVPELFTPWCLMQAGYSRENRYACMRNVVEYRQPRIDHDALPAYMTNLDAATDQFFKGKRVELPRERDTLRSLIETSRIRDHQLLSELDQPRLILSQGQYPRLSALDAYTHVKTAKYTVTLPIPIPALPDFGIQQGTIGVEMTVLLGDKGQLAHVNIYARHGSFMKYGGANTPTDLSHGICLDFLMLSHATISRGSPTALGWGQYASSAMPSAPGSVVGAGHAALTHWHGLLISKDKAQGLKGYGSNEWSINAQNLPDGLKRYLDFAGIEYENIPQEDGSGRSWLSRVSGDMISSSIRKKATPQERSERAIRGHQNQKKNPEAYAAVREQAVITRRKTAGWSDERKAQEADRIRAFTELGKANLAKLAASPPDVEVPGRFVAGHSSAGAALSFADRALHRGVQLVQTHRYRDGIRILILDAWLSNSLRPGPTAAPLIGQYMTAEQVQAYISSAANSQSGEFEDWYCDTEDLLYARMTDRNISDILELAGSKAGCLFCENTLDSNHPERPFSTTCRPVMHCRGIVCKMGAAQPRRTVGKLDSLSLSQLSRIIVEHDSHVPAAKNRSQSGISSAVAELTGEALRKWKQQQKDKVKGRKAKKEN